MRSGLQTRSLAKSPAGRMGPLNSEPMLVHNLKAVWTVPNFPAASRGS